MELENLINQSGENAESKGFHDDGNLLRAVLAQLDKGTTNGGGTLLLGESAINIPEGFWDRIYAAYKGNRLMLMVGELVETHEEVRSGKPAIYEENGKPEGTAVELGDVQIRLGDYAWEFGEPVIEAIETKAKYNATRAKMHGGRLF